ncbi:MAG: ATP-binding cassette domain-containing protein [Tessaracoccus sp.]|uniref:ABC transporter ATP-binding protein n=1 Tax=Tessaracoccus sp. TaxID=1971211 RepID=UPI001EBEDC5E|nr:ATP-binding cassette domain-containing protein [Tessaracoccus sp.]MBK7822573.1 ATP-binding cassette domain-containing protein [Tessaracoccus sp.]
MSIIDAEGLTREFVVYEGAGLRRKRRVVHAVEGLTLRVEAGEAVGYIGANGSGKSTTIKMVSGILTPTSGSIHTCGLRPVPERRTLARRIGVVFGQRSALWWDLPLEESFPILAAMHRMPRAAWRSRFDVLVDELELSSFLARPVRTLSLGQRMRGEVAAALLHSPSLAVLDEPTIGLDMISKENLRRFLARERAERGTTLLLTTHDMGDVQRLCDRMVVIDGGRVAFDGTEAELVAATDAERILVVDLAEPVAGTLRLPDGAAVTATEADGVRLSISFRPQRLSAAQVLAAVQAQAEVIELSLAEPAIEDLVRRIYASGAASSGTD